VKTYVTILLFTTQPELPQHNLSHLAQKSTQCSTWPGRVKPPRTQSSHTHIYTHTHIRNMISVTLNTSVTNLTFTINSIGPKMKLRRLAFAPYLQTYTRLKYVRPTHGIVGTDYYSADWQIHGNVKSQRPKRPRCP